MLDWPDALQLARKNLEQTPAAPPWLVQVLAAAGEVAPALAPKIRPKENMPEFFYPH